MLPYTSPSTRVNGSYFVFVYSAQDVRITYPGTCLVRFTRMFCLLQVPLRLNCVFFVESSQRPVPGLNEGGKGELCSNPIKSYTNHSRTQPIRPYALSRHISNVSQKDMYPGIHPKAVHRSRPSMPPHTCAHSPLKCHTASSTKSLAVHQWSCLHQSNQAISWRPTVWRKQTNQRLANTTSTRSTQRPPLRLLTYMIFSAEDFCPPFPSSTRVVCMS